MRHSVRRFLQDQRGAIAILSTFMAATLVSMTYYAIGTGDAILYRERLGDASDASSYAAAVYHASGSHGLSCCLQALPKWGPLSCNSRLQVTLHQLLVSGGGTGSLMFGHWDGTPSSLATQASILAQAFSSAGTSGTLSQVRRALTAADRVGSSYGSKEFFTACVQAWLARLPFTGDLRAIVLECTPTTLKCDIPPRDVVRDIREVFERNFTALASARFFDAVRRADISNESWMDECRFYLKGDLYHLGYLACLELEVGRVLDHTSEEFRQNILEAEEARGWNP